MCAELRGTVGPFGRRFGTPEGRSWVQFGNQAYLPDFGHQSAPRAASVSPSRVRLAPSGDIAPHLSENTSARQEHRASTPPAPDPTRKGRKGAGYPTITARRRDPQVCQESRTSSPFGAGPLQRTAAISRELTGLGVLARTIEGCRNAARFLESLCSITQERPTKSMSGLSCVVEVGRPCSNLAPHTKNTWQVSLWQVNL